MTRMSHVWFTVGDGTLNEVFYPAVDKANTRDLELIVTDGESFTDCESTDMIHTVEYPDKNALIVRQVNSAKSGRYQIVKTTIADPARDVVLIRVELKVLQPGPPLKAYVMYDPSLNNSGLHDTGFNQGNALLAMKVPADLAQAKRDEPPPTPVAAPANASISGWSLPVLPARPRAASRRR